MERFFSYNYTAAVSMSMNLVTNCVVTIVDVSSESAIKGVIDGSIKGHVARSTGRIKTRKVHPKFQPDNRSKLDIATLEDIVVWDASQKLCGERLLAGDEVGFLEIVTGCREATVF